MFNEVPYWVSSSELPAACTARTTFPSMFDANSANGQLDLDMSALATAFSALDLSESDIFLTLGDFFWSVGSGRCAFTAYKRAKRVGPLPDTAAARLNALQKSAFRDKMFVITGSLFCMERAEALFEIRKRGGLTSNSPINTMDFLVLGYQEWSELNDGIASRKVQKAADLQKKGRDVKIISEEEFCFMLNDEP